MRCYVSTVAPYEPSEHFTLHSNQLSLFKDKCHTANVNKNVILPCISSYLGYFLFPGRPRTKREKGHPGNEFGLFGVTSVSHLQEMTHSKKHAFSFFCFSMIACTSVFTFHIITFI